MTTITKLIPQVAEKFLNNINVTGATGYHNTNFIVVSNATMNAIATFTTNAAGQFGNTDIVVRNVGRFAPAQINTDAKFTVYAANGAASNGTGATLVANLAVNNWQVNNANTNLSGAKLVRLLNTDAAVAMVTVSDSVTNVQIGSIPLQIGAEITLEKHNTDVLSCNNNTGKVLGVPVAYKN